MHGSVFGVCMNLPGRKGILARLLHGLKWSWAWESRFEAGMLKEEGLRSRYRYPREPYRYQLVSKCTNRSRRFSIDTPQVGIDTYGLRGRREDKG